MPRTCSICIHQQRKQIDAALAAGEPCRSIAQRYEASAPAVLRHKPHVGASLVRAAERREVNLGDSLLDGLARVQRKAWELLQRLEQDGDHRGAVVALRECREILTAIDGTLGRAHATEAMRVIVEVVGDAAGE